MILKYMYMIHSDHTRVQHIPCIFVACPLLEASDDILVSTMLSKIGISFNNLSVTASFTTKAVILPSGLTRISHSLITKHENNQEG